MRPNLQHASAPTAAHLRALPHAERCERALLGTILMKPGQIDLARTLIPAADCWHLERHRWTWEAMCHLRDTGAALEVLTIEARLKDQGRLDQAGGMAFLAGLDLDLPDPEALETYADRVRETWARRQTIRALQSATTASWDGGEDIREILGDLSDALTKIGRTRESGSGFRSLAELMGELDLFAEPEQRPATVRTGHADLDHLTGGLRGGQLVVLAASPGAGKTSFALQAATDVAIRGGRVAVFSLEMTGQELRARILSQRTKHPEKEIMSGELLPRHKADVSDIMEEAVEEWAPRIMIDDTGSLSTQQIVASVTLLNLRQRLSLVVVDYLKLVKYVGDQKKLVHQLGEVARSLKVLAKSLDVPVIAVHHLNRMSDIEIRRPCQGDLRDSGEVEANADMVWLLWRPVTVNPSPKDLTRLEIDGVNLETYAEIIVAKNRGGQTGRIPCVWLGGCTSFEAVDNRHQEPF